MSSRSLEPWPVTELSDETLRQQLELAITKRFYETCDGVTQALLMNCDWAITTRAIALTLVITSFDSAIHWRVLNHLTIISTYLAPFTNKARIRVNPLTGSELPLEIRVDEMLVIGD
jgi:hypothetical protein